MTKSMAVLLMMKEALKYAESDYNVVVHDTDGSAGLVYEVVGFTVDHNHKEITINLGEAMRDARNDKS